MMCHYTAVLLKVHGHGIMHATVVTGGSSIGCAVITSWWQSCSDCGCMQEDEIQKAIFVGNYDAAVDTCLKVGRLADALLIANIGGADLFKKTMQRYMRRNPRPYMAVSLHASW